VMDCSEHGDEPLGSIKCRKHFDRLSVLFASQQGLCSMELVRMSVVKQHIFLTNTQHTHCGRVIFMFWVKSTVNFQTCHQ
jgi:hypothetical protein